MDDRGGMLRYTGDAGHARRRCGTGNRGAHRSAPGHWDRSTAAVVRTRVGREPMPWSVVPKAYVRVAWSVVAGDEPPDVPIEVPTRMNEHIVDSHLDAVPIDPSVLSVAVVPVPMDPNPGRAVLDLLVARRDPRRRRRLHRGGDGLWFLHHDDGLPLDFRGRARFRFYDHVARRFRRIHCTADSAVAVMGNVELVVGLARSVAGGPLVVVRYRYHRRSGAQAR